MASAAKSASTWKFIDTSKSLNEGAILFEEYAVDSRGWNILGQSKLFDLDKKLSTFSDDELDLLWYSKPFKVKMQIAGKAHQYTLRGIVEQFTAKYITGDLNILSERRQNPSCRTSCGAMPGLQRRALEPARAELQDRRAQHR